ncbi:MAG: efflux RND transporter periplasmic adaptor subunit [Opitutaceae bacterium]
MHSRRPHLPCLLALCAAAFASGCGRTPPPAGTPQAALTVELVSPVRSEWAERIEAVGSIAPWQESVIGAEVGDLRLEEVLVDVGDVVAKGQLLARFAAELPAADLKLAEAAVAQAEAGAALACDKAARARQLGSRGVISDEALQQLEAEEKTSAAQLAAAKAQLEVQRLRLRHIEVRAPDAGVVSSRSATVGAVAGVGTELFRLIRHGRLEWRSTVPADRLSRLVPGQTAVLRPGGETAIPGIVRQIAPVVDAATLNGTVHVDLGAPGPLRAGMFVAGEFQLPATAVLYVPESALVFRDGFQYVMRVDGSNSVHAVKVSTGRRSGLAVEIIGPSPTAADRIVRSGGSFLNEGDTVRVATPGSGDSVAVSPADADGGRP